MDRIHMGLPDTTSTLISQLNYGINETTIMVRVIRAWKSISSYNSDEIVANFILLDEEDNQLLAIAANKERDRVWPNLCEGLAYFIKNFKIVVSPTKWKPIASERSLLFCRGTKIENCCKGHNISTLKFDLRLLSGVQNQHQPDDSLIDVCGVVLQIHDLLYYSNVIENLKLTIMDSRIPIDTANGHFDTDAPIKKFPGMHQLCLFEPLPQQKVAISKTAIQELLPIANWDGDSCACCSRDVILQQDSYYCTRCNKQYTPIIKRSMRILLADEYGAISEFIIQPREIAQLIGISPLQLMSARSDQFMALKGAKG
ncbi:hypothetical protein POM88_001069 [Heracleum sosnowskyi]|uniref:Uncharacterized protein n=1 Tax=Heracleum sosnowskyi TaxID=360622 RepID=A0AAD8N9B2_9APIA|nr:hypothetical protein POM88_001069 [Heracleum sosnowskyi]